MRMLVKRMLIAFGAIDIPTKKKSHERRICCSFRTNTLRDDQSSYRTWRKCQGFMSHQSHIARSWSILNPGVVPSPFTRLSIFWLASQRGLHEGKKVGFAPATLSDCSLDERVQSSPLPERAA